MIARKLFAHYTPEELIQFTYRKPGAFEPLLRAGILSEEDGANIRRHALMDFSVTKDPRYSRQYDFFFSVDTDTSFCVQLNHCGDPIHWDDPRQEQDVSSDLLADVKLMWSVDEKGRSTQDSIWAASRVFNTVDLVGKDRNQILAVIGSARTRRPNGYYNAPFFPTDKSDMVYRFDNGSYGWQFNVKMNTNGFCTKVERLGIH